MLKYPEHSTYNSYLIVVISVVLIIHSSCEKQNLKDSENNQFTLSSPEIGSDSLLPAAYTCDGESATLPLVWNNAPYRTVIYALVMHHVASPVDIHWYWVLYNIPSAVTSLPKNVSGIGIPGTNSVNDRTEYAPPCSQGPGPKYYTLTIYALSDTVRMNLLPSEVTRQVLLNAIRDIVLDSASMTVVYSRNI